MAAGAVSHQLATCGVRRHRADPVAVMVLRPAGGRLQCPWPALGGRLAPGCGQSRAGRAEQTLDVRGLGAGPELRQARPPPAVDAPSLPAPSPALAGRSPALEVRPCHERSHRPAARLDRGRALRDARRRSGVAWPPRRACGSRTGRGARGRGAGGGAPRRGRGIARRRALRRDPACAGGDGDRARADRLDHARRPARADADARHDTRGGRACAARDRGAVHRRRRPAPPRAGVSYPWRAGVPDRPAADGAITWCCRTHRHRTGSALTNAQLAFVSATCLLLWLAFTFVQTVRHREHFLPNQTDAAASAVRPTARSTAASLGLLVVALVAVVLLAKGVSPFIQAAVAGLGAPPARWASSLPRSCCARRRDRGARGAR